MADSTSSQDFIESQPSIITNMEETLRKKQRVDAITTPEQSSTSSSVFSYPSLNQLYTPTPFTPTGPNCCELCKLSCNSRVQLEAHLNSKAHLDKLRPAEVFDCGACGLSFNSSSQLNSHNNGKKHQDNVAKLGGYLVLRFIYLLFYSC